MSRTSGGSLSKKVLGLTRELLRIYFRVCCVTRALMLDYEVPNVWSNAMFLARSYGELTPPTEEMRKCQVALPHQHFPRVQFREPGGSTT